MVWCVSTRASVATVLTTHPCVSKCLRVKSIFIKSILKFIQISFWKFIEIPLMGEAPGGPFKYKDNLSRYMDYQWGLTSFDSLHMKYNFRKSNSSGDDNHTIIFTTEGHKQQHSTQMWYYKNLNSTIKYHSSMLPNTFMYVSPSIVKRKQKINLTTKDMGCGGRLPFESISYNKIYHKRGKLCVPSQFFFQHKGNVMYNQNDHVLTRHMTPLE